MLSQMTCSMLFSSERTCPRPTILALANRICRCIFTSVQPPSHQQWPIGDLNRCAEADQSQKRLILETMYSKVLLSHVHTYGDQLFSPLSCGVRIWRRYPRTAHVTCVLMLASEVT
eukprot:2574387-Amphidinium_carterae.1